MLPDVTQVLPPSRLIFGLPDAPETEMPVAVSKPVSFTAADVTVAPSGCMVAAAMLKAFGVVSSVVTVQVAATPPAVTVAVVTAPWVLGVVSRTVNELLAEISPEVTQELPPSRLICGVPNVPVTEMPVAASKPVSVTGEEVTVAFSGCSGAAGMLKAAGVVLSVVTTQFADTPPAVTVAVLVAPSADAEVMRTRNGAFGSIVPEVTQVLVLSSEICALGSPLTAMDVPVLKPVSVTADETAIVLTGSGPVAGMLKADGVVVGAAVVTVKLALTPPAVTVAVSAVLPVEADVRRTRNAVFGRMLPLALQVVPPSSETCGLPWPVAEIGAALLKPASVTAEDDVGVENGALPTAGMLKAVGVVLATIPEMVAVVALLPMESVAVTVKP